MRYMSEFKCLLKIIKEFSGKSMKDWDFINMEYVEVYILYCKVVFFVWFGYLLDLYVKLLLLCKICKESWDVYRNL